MSRVKLDFSKRPVSLTRWSARRGRVCMEIGQEYVEVTERSLMGPRQWREKLTAFAGVQLNSDVENRPQAGMRQWHEVVLRHRDPEKTLVLYGSSRLGDARAAWRGAAESLHLPAIEKTPLGFMVREAEELDKPFRDIGKERLLARAGRIDRPPISIECKRRGPVTRAVLRLNGVAVLPMLLLVGVGGLFTWLGSVLGPPLAIAGILLFVLWLNARKGLEVTPAGVACSWMTPFGDFGRRAIPFEELHTVAWTRTGGPENGNTALLLASDETEIALENIPRQQADWLAKLVMAAAIGADTRFATA